MQYIIVIAGVRILVHTCRRLAFETPNFLLNICYLFSTSFQVYAPITSSAFKVHRACSRGRFARCFRYNFLILSPAMIFSGQPLLPCMCCSHGFHMEQIAKFSLVGAHVPSARVTADNQSHAGVVPDLICYWEEGIMGTVGVCKKHKYIRTKRLQKAWIILDYCD